MRTFFLLILISILFGQCQSQVPIDNIEQQPVPTDADREYANVYQPLDGTWEGDFIIYEDTVGGARLIERLYQLSSKSLQHPHLKRSNSIKVTQKYLSKSPYFQTVTITDYYPKQDKTVTSKGVNKVQDGKMWCVVRKPDETVIHEGHTEGQHTIIWQRNEQAPQRIEYFYETVLADTYEIIGWGYYEGQDTMQMPRYWFYGSYQKQ